MQQRTRFDCPSASLRLGVLLRRAQSMLWIGLAFAVGVHGAFSTVDVFRQEIKGARPLTTKFIKRAPRLSKPLELKKRPPPKRREMTRQMVSMKPKADRQQVTSNLASVQVVQVLAKPEADMSRVASFVQTAAEPKVLAEQIVGSQQPKHTMSLSLEMLDTESLDTGRYQAMVIQDPTDKRNIKGFFHLAIVYSVTMRDRSYHGDDIRTARGLRSLTHAMNRYTDIQSDVKGTYTFASREFYHTPFVYSCARYSFKVTASEAQSLGKYLLGGGFFVADLVPHDGVDTTEGIWQRVDVSNRTMFKDALATQKLLHGRDWDFQKLPNSHPLYHCFFDFPHGPPICGDHLLILEGYTPFDYLEGIIIEDRLLAVPSRKWFANPWGDWMGQTEYYGELDGTRQLQFGVNIIIFALTQEGSITNQVMDGVSY